MSLRGLADRVASAGRYGDNQIVHMNPAEVAALDRYVPGGLPRNPDTGQPEAFIFPILAGMLGGAAFPALGLGSAALGAGVGSGIASTVETGDPVQGVLSGLLSYGMGSALDKLAGIGGNPVSVTGQPSLSAADQFGGGLSSLGKAASPGPGAMTTSPVTLSGMPGAGATAQGFGPDIMGSLTDTAMTKPAGLQSTMANAARQTAGDAARLPMASPEAVNNMGFMEKLRAAGQGIDTPGAARQVFLDDALETTVPIGVGAAGQMGMFDGLFGGTGKQLEREEGPGPAPPLNRQLHAPPPGYVPGGNEEWDYFRRLGYAGGGQVVNRLRQLASQIGSGAGQGNPLNGIMRFLGGGGNPSLSPAAAPAAAAALGATGASGGPSLTPGQPPPTGAYIPSTAPGGYEYRSPLFQASGSAPGGTTGGSPSGGLPPGVGPERNWFPDRVSGFGPPSSPGPSTPPPQPALSRPLYRGSPDNYSTYDEFMGRAPDNRAAGGLVKMAGGGPVAFAEGGPTGGEINPISLIEMTKAAVRGEVEDPEPIIEMFIERFGPELFQELRRRVIAGMKGRPSEENGRMIDGPGGGMDDAIPAAIDGQQPAALSDGEFVIPADVVSAIGDGSSDAGADKLNMMMGNVRKQKTGTQRQPPKMREDFFPV